MRNPLLAEILPPENAELVSPSESARLAVDRLLDDIRDNELGLAANYARLGSVLFEIRRQRYYEGWGFLSFGSYIANLADRVRKERSQLYAYIGVAEKLLPYIAEQQLVQIGISKAEQLKKFVQQSGLRPPPRLIEKALEETTTIKEMRAEVYRELRQEPDPQGKFFDFGGCYLDADERKEVNLAFQLACRVDPVIPHDVPEHMRKKEIMLRLCREFIGEYIHLLEGK